MNAARDGKRATCAAGNTVTPPAGQSKQCRGRLEEETKSMPIIVQDILQALAAGLLVGGTYGLMCVGLGIIFGVMRVVNFAQGEFMMLGMYTAFYLVSWLGQSPGL